jgi:hypothetical protein
MFTRKCLSITALLLCATMPVLLGVSCPANPGAIPVPGSGSPSGGNSSGGTPVPGDGGSGGGTGGGGTVAIALTNTTTQFVQMALFASSDANISSLNLFLAENVVTVSGQTAVIISPQSSVTATLACSNAQALGAAMTNTTGNIFTNPIDRAGPYRQTLDFDCGASVIFRTQESTNTPDDVSAFHISVLISNP